MQDIQQVQRKVVILEAMQYDGSNESAQSIVEWVSSHEEGDWNVTQTRDRYSNKVRVQTSTCDITLNPTYWVVREANGRFNSYPMYEFGDIFEFVEDEN